MLTHSIRKTKSQSAVVFLCNKKGTVPRLHRLYANGLPQSAVQDYSESGVFSQDPFLSPTVMGRGMGNTGCLVIEPTDCAVQRHDSAPQYWAFLSRYQIGITGAVIKPISSDIFLVASLHRHLCQSGAGITSVADYMGNVLDCAASQLMTMAVQTIENDGSSAAVTDSKKFALRYKLNQKEMDIVALVAEGFLNKQIAFELLLAEHTVENHLRRIYAKVGVHNRSTLISRFLALY